MIDIRDDIAALVSAVSVMYQTMQTNGNAFRHTRALDETWATIKRLSEKYPSDPRAAPESH